MTVIVNRPTCNILDSLNPSLREEGIMGCCRNGPLTCMFVSFYNDNSDDHYHCMFLFTC